MESIDQILKGRTSLRKLRPIFGSWEDVLHFYAEEVTKALMGLGKCPFSYVSRSRE